MKKNKLLFVVIGLCFVAVISVIVYSAMPMIYHSKEYIQNKLLKDTPIGSDKKQVLAYFHTKNYIDYSEVQSSFEERMQPHRKIGNHHIQVYLGHYRGIPFRCDVTVFWVFDKDEKLIHIDVWKDYDAL